MTSNAETMRSDDDNEVVVQVSDEEIEKLLESLPKATSLNGTLSLAKYQGFWYHSMVFKRMVAFQRHFHAKDTDIIIASHPKTGTTWLKCLLYTVVNRSNHPLNQSPILNHNPHELVYDLEYEIYNPKSQNIMTRTLIDEIPPPRLLNFHFPCSSLPQSIKTSKCRILYISRNPLDTIVSQWHFYCTNMKKKMMMVAQESGHRADNSFKPPPIEDYFEVFCDGRILYGPFFDHLNAFWKWSLEEPNKYEDLKVEPTFWLKKIADFAGVPFSSQEESQGAIQQIIELCSIGNLKDLKVNKQGRLRNLIFDKKDFFRKGEVGDWTRYFSPQMVETMNKLMDANFGTTGLSFDLVV